MAETLADRIAQGPLSVDEALPIAKQIADALEAAPLEYQDLAAAAFLRGGSEDADRDAELVRDLGQSKTRADRARGDDVMAARMADPGQCIVFRTDPDVQRSGAGARDAARPPRS